MIPLCKKTSSRSSDMTEEKKRPKKPLGHARLISGKCIACGARCQAGCPASSIEMNEKGEPVIDLEKCIGCRRCVRVCPASALEVFFTPEEQKRLAEMAAEAAEKKTPVTPEVDEELELVKGAMAQFTGVWVFIEQTGGVAAEALDDLDALADRGAEMARAFHQVALVEVVGAHPHLD